MTTPYDRVNLMNPAPRYCFCRADQPPWPARPDDRYCGLCGRELLAALPRAPLLTPGPPSLLAAYLRLAAPPAPAWTGRLSFQLVGLDGAAPEVRWQPLTTPPLQVTASWLSGSKLEMEVGLEAVAPPPGEALGQARLVLVLNGRPFLFGVRAFAVPTGRGRAWLTSRPGEPPEGPVMVVYRDARRARTYLEFDAGPGVPVQWESIQCDHPAVTVTLLHPDQAQVPARAEVCWNPARLRGEMREEAVFQLEVLGLPPVTLKQHFHWRLRRPFRCQPPVLVVDALDVDTPETRMVRLTNEEREPLTLRAVESQANWVACSLPDGQSLCVPSGQSTTVAVHLLPQEIGPAAPPHETTVSLHISRRGRQSYTVRVEAVRGPRRLDGPLLLDPGPPRVVLARWEPRGRRVVYLPCSGDGGLAPEALGVTSDDYGEAVYGRRPAHAVLRYLVAAALTRLRMQDRVEAPSVRLCRHPWVPVDFQAPGVAVHDWEALVLQHCGAGGPTRPVPFRLDAFEAYVADGPGRAAPLLGLAERHLSVGAGLMRWVARRFAESLWVRGARIPQALPAVAGGAEPPPGFLWMRLACEDLLRDYRWGPAYAWRQLLAAWQARLAAGPDPFSLRDAHQQVVRRTADYVQQVCMAVVRRGAAEGAARLVVVGPLSRGRRFQDVLRSLLTSAGFESESAPAPWAEWLAPPADGPGG